MNLRTIMAMAAVLIAGTGEAQGQADQGRFEQRARPIASEPAPVSIEPEVVRFLDVMPETFVDSEVMIFNEGDQPLRILQTRSTCSCTVPELERKVIMPGEGVPMQVTFETPEFMGRVKRNVFIYIQGYSVPVKLDVEADVNYGIRPRMTYSPPGQFRTGEFSLESADGTPFRILSADGREPIYLDGFDPKTDEARTSYTIRVDLTRYSDETLPEWFLVETDHPTAPVIDLRVYDPEKHAQASRQVKPWKLKKDRVLLWRIDPASTHEFEITMQGEYGDPYRAIDDIRFSGDARDVRLRGMEMTRDGLKLRFIVVTPSMEPGVFLTRVTIVAQGHEEELDLIGRITDE